MLAVARLRLLQIQAERQGNSVLVGDVQKVLQVIDPTGSDIKELTKD